MGWGDAGIVWRWCCNLFAIVIKCGERVPCKVRSQDMGILNARTKLMSIDGSTSVRVTAAVTAYEVSFDTLGIAGVARVRVRMLGFLPDHMSGLYLYLCTSSISTSISVRLTLTRKHGFPHAPNNRIIRYLVAMYGVWSEGWRSWLGT